MTAARRVDKGDVHLVHRILKTLQVVAGHGLDRPGLDQSVVRRDRVGREVGRLARPEIAEHEAHMLARRPRADPHLAGEARLRGGLFNALACAVEFPAVIDASDVVILDPAEMHLRTAMRAAVGNDLRPPGAAAVERVILAHDADGLGFARPQVVAARDGEPEPAEEFATGRAGSRARQVDAVAIERLFLGALQIEWGHPAVPRNCTVLIAAATDYCASAAAETVTGPGQKPVRWRIAGPRSRPSCERLAARVHWRRAAGRAHPRRSSRRGAGSATPRRSCAQNPAAI